MHIALLKTFLRNVTEIKESTYMHPLSRAASYGYGFHRIAYL